MGNHVETRTAHELEDAELMRAAVDDRCRVHRHFQLSLCKIGAPFVDKQIAFTHFASLCARRILGLVMSNDAKI